MTTMLSSKLTVDEAARLLTLIRRSVKIASIASTILDTGWRIHPGPGRRELEVALDKLNEIVNDMAANNDIIRRRK